MSDENPTTDDSGASINDRLERYLAAEDEPEQEQTDSDPEARAAQDNDVEPEEGEQEDTQPQWSTTDFAKSLGIDESAVDLDTDGSVVIKTKIDGKEGTAKFADVLKSYQLQGHIDNKARAVAAQEQAMQQRMAAAEQAVEERVQRLDGLAKVATQELTREYNSIDWQWLRENNPGEYSARLTDFQYRQNQIGQIEQTAAQERDQLKQQRNQTDLATLREQAQKIPSLIPEWKDNAVADKERQEIIRWAMKSGATPERVQKMNDAFDVSAYRKAMLYDQLQTSKTAIEHKVRTAPKLVKAGQSNDSSREQTNAKNMKTNVRKSGGKESDVVAYLLASGKV